MTTFKGKYILERIPPDTWERAKAKAASYKPPMSMRWVLIQLLEKWAPRPKGTRKRKAVPRPIATVQRDVIPGTTISTPEWEHPIPKYIRTAAGTVEPSAPPTDAPDLDGSLVVGRRPVDPVGLNQSDIAALVGTVEGGNDEPFF